MAPSELHVIGIDPGFRTGWARLTVPRKCLFATAPSEIISSDYGEICGEEEDQALSIANFAVVLQGMDYQVGPAFVVEDFDIPPHAPTTDPELLSPVRIAAMLCILQHIGKMADATVTLQRRSDAKGTATDDRLKAWGYWVPLIEGGDHARDAMRHAIVALRRARQNRDFRDKLWNARACTL
jgi:hypothetical protein